MQCRHHLVKSAEMLNLQPRGYPCLFCIVYENSVFRFIVKKNSISLNSVLLTRLMPVIMRACADLKVYSDGFGQIRGSKEILMRAYP